MPVTRAGGVVPTGSISSAEITDDSIVDADVNSAAAIAYSKLNLSNSIVAGDIAANAVGASEIGSLPSCRAYRSIAKSIADATVTVVDFDAERWDTDTIHVLSGTSERLTCNTAGVYHIFGHVAFAHDADGVREVRIRLNGTDNLASATVGAYATNTALTVSVNTHAKLAATDYVELTVFHTAGGALDIQASDGTTTRHAADFGMSWLGDG